MVAEAYRKATQQQSLAVTASAYWSTRTQARLFAIAEMAVKNAKEEQRVVYAKVEQGTLATVERARVDVDVVLKLSPHVRVPVERVAEGLARHGPQQLQRREVPQVPLHVGLALEAVARRPRALRALDAGPEVADGRAVGQARADFT